MKIDRFLFGIRTYLYILIGFTFMFNESLNAQCYGEWEYIPGSAEAYLNIEHGPAIGPYTTVRYDVPSPLHNHFTIEKDKILCEKYAIGYNDQTRETIWSNTPKYEDAIGDGILIKPGAFNFAYPPMSDIKGWYTSNARVIGYCGYIGWGDPHGKTLFDCYSGILMRFEYNEGEIAALYWRYKRVDNGTDVQIRDYAIRADAEPKSVKPDGESTLEIIATLYDYVPGDMQSARPIAGKTLNFHVRSQYGIVPGTLSDVSAVTDENGQARVTYTAPKAELLSESRSLINTSTVAARSEEFDVDDLAYIHFIPDRGEVRVQPPIKGIISDHGIVPPDGRFPALIRALIEDSDLQPLPSTPVNVALKGDHTYGMLRAPDGTESKELTLITDGRGWVELQYFFASDRIPEAAVIETIEIKTAHMSIPLRAKVSIGLNLVFDRVESAYEGRGIINAGENIPVRMRIKDAWYPEIDLSRILNYWGWGRGAGDTRLYPRLEIENLSSIPDYLLDHLRQQRYPEPGFDEMMKVVTFRSETGEIREQNLLYVFESSLRPYGHPQVRPVASGNHYYQARISLVDQHGETIPHARHPATKTYFNLQTDMPADALYIYFVNNPLRPQTPEAEWYAFALDFMGMGTLISVVDAMDAINRGDTEALFDIMFSELKGFFMDKAKDNSPDFKKVMDGYSRLTMAKTVLDEIDKSVSGVVAQLEHQLFTRLAKNIDNEKEELIILKGTGNQKLFLTAPEEEANGSNRKKGRSLFGGLINIQITGVDEKTQERVSRLIGRKKEAEIPAYENRLHVDKRLGIYSLKFGNVSYFIIPAGLEVDYENATEMLRY